MSAAAGVPWVEVALAVCVFTGLVTTLVGGVIAARVALRPQGVVEIVLNGRQHIRAALSETLLRGLDEAGVHLPSACGGKGTCALCRVTVVSGGGEPLPTERARLPRRDVASGVRLACQVIVREPLELRVPEAALEVRKLRCRVRSARCVSTLIREIVLELPEGEAPSFRAGEYVTVHCPPYQTRFHDLPIDAEARDEWDRLDLWRYESGTGVATERAYSMANHPGEHGIVMLDVRIALPPPGAPEDAPPGVVSSYLFSLRPGDEVTISGPYGDFFAREGEHELILVGGGAGMAPLRAHAFDQLVCRGTQRKLSYWYGARSRRELFYAEDFESLAARHDNFRFEVALSEPGPEDGWQGEVGFIHEVLYRRYLAEHPAPEDCEYLLCGPPMMIRATRALLDTMGVDPENIRFDDFGT